MTVTETEKAEYDALASSLCDDAMLWGHTEDPPRFDEWGQWYDLYNISRERLREMAGRKTEVERLRAALGRIQQAIAAYNEAGQQGFRPSLEWVEQVCLDALYGEH